MMEKDGQLEEQGKECTSNDEKKAQQKPYPKQPYTQPQVGELRRRKIHPHINEEASQVNPIQSSNIQQSIPTSVVEVSMPSAVSSIHLEQSMQQIQDMRLPSLPQHSSINQSHPPSIISSSTSYVGLEVTDTNHILQQQQQQQQQHHRQNISSSLYTYSSDSHTGRVLTYLSNIFLKKRNKKEFTKDQSKHAECASSQLTNQPMSNLCDDGDYDVDKSRSGSAFAGFLSLLMVTCANYMLSPMRDAAALAVGVSHIPLLTFVSTVLALGSSVPVGWLFEAPNPDRRGRSWRGKIGLTRGETQGTSLALFYRCFAICLIGYAFTFKIFEILGTWNVPSDERGDSNEDMTQSMEVDRSLIPTSWDYDELMGWAYHLGATLLKKFGKGFYVAFFLVVHLMKLHSLSLIWGVTSEAMEYEEQAELREKRRRRRYEMENASRNSYLYRGPTQDNMNNNDRSPSKADMGKKKSKLSSIRVKRLAFVGFGGTLGGIIGSVFVSITAHTLRLSGLLTVSAVLLELSARLSTELGQIMLRHWQEEQMERGSDEDLLILGRSNSSDQVDDTDGDSSMKRTTSVGSMKRIASGNMIQNLNLSSNEPGVDSSLKKVSSIGSMKRVASGNSIGHLSRAKHSGEFRIAENNASETSVAGTTIMTNKEAKQSNVKEESPPTIDDNSFKQRLLRGITTILRSRLLMTIFTYNALYATTSVLLSFQRAELVANRNTVTGGDKSVAADTAFLARINMASSVGVFILQASGMGAFIASSCGQRGTLSLMPMVRLLGVALLALWHVKTSGEPPNLIVFLVLDEFTKVINFAVAKPVREGLWLGLSNEARYEAKPIVDTLANRWGGGSAAFLMSLLDHIMILTGLGDVAEDGTKTLFGFPPLLILCSVAAAWWTMVSIDLGNIRHRIDVELKKQQ